jgi:hypothetical protein
MPELFTFNIACKTYYAIVIGQYLSILLNYFVEGPEFFVV